MSSRSSDRKETVLVRRSPIARETTPHAVTEIGEADYASHLADAFPTDFGHTDAAVTVVAPLESSAPHAPLAAAQLAGRGEGAVAPRSAPQRPRSPVAPARGGAPLQATPPSPRPAAQHEGGSRRTLVMPHAPRPARSLPPPTSAPPRARPPVIPPVASALPPALRLGEARPGPPWAIARAAGAEAAAPRASVATSGSTVGSAAVLARRRVVVAVVLLLALAAGAVVRVTTAPAAPSAALASAPPGPPVSPTPSASVALAAASPPQEQGPRPPAPPPPSSPGAPRTDRDSAIVARAVDALADGRPLEAATLYETLAALGGSDPSYAVAARILRAREAP